MKTGVTTDETRLLCCNCIDTTEQLLPYKGSLESEMQELIEQHRGLYSQSRKSTGEEKETVKARLSEVTERMRITRKEIRLYDGVFTQSDITKEKLQTIWADEKEQ